MKQVLLFLFLVSPLYAMELIGEGCYSFSRCDWENKIMRVCVVNEAGKQVYDRCNEKLYIVNMVRQLTKQYKLPKGWATKKFGDNFINEGVDAGNWRLTLSLIDTCIHEVMYRDAQQQLAEAAEQRVNSSDSD